MQLEQTCVMTHLNNFGFDVPKESKITTNDNKDCLLTETVVKIITLFVVFDHSLFMEESNIKAFYFQVI